MRKSKNNVLFWIIIIVVITGISVGMYFFLKSNSNEQFKTHELVAGTQYEHDGTTKNRFAPGEQGFKCKNYTFKNHEKYADGAWGKTVCEDKNGNFASGAYLNDDGLKCFVTENGDYEWCAEEKRLRETKTGPCVDMFIDGSEYGRDKILVSTDCHDGSGMYIGPNSNGTEEDFCYYTETTDRCWPEGWEKRNEEGKHGSVWKWDNKKATMCMYNYKNDILVLVNCRDKSGWWYEIHGDYGYESGCKYYHYRDINTGKMVETCQKIDTLSEEEQKNIRIAFADEKERESLVWPFSE
jgi:hypothetical protein